MARTFYIKTVILYRSPQEVQSCSFPEEKLKKFKLGERTISLKIHLTLFKLTYCSRQIIL